MLFAQRFTRNLPCPQITFMSAGYTAPTFRRRSEMNSLNPIRKMLLSAVLVSAASTMSAQVTPADPTTCISNRLGSKAGQGHGHGKVKTQRWR